MAGNTRGKLKEHLEGIHRNLDWAVQHCNKSLALIAAQLSFTDEMLAAGDDEQAKQKILEENKVYRSFMGIGKLVQQVDELTLGVYKNI